MELLLVAPGAFAISTPDRIQFADGLYARGLYDLALKEYLPLLAAQPAVTNLDAVLFRSAECYRYLQDKKNAGLTYEQLLQRFPQSPFAWRAEFRRAEMSATGGEYLDAIGRFRALTEKNPPAEIAASAYYYLGYSQDRMNMKEEAAKAFKTVVHEYPNSPFFSYACIGLADIEQRLGASAEELRGLYEKAARAPATPRVGAEAWFQLGESYYRDGDFSNAAHAYEQLLTRYPSDPRGDEARLPAAWSFHNIERFADALKIADSALKKVGPNEREADWKYLQANALRQLQRVDEARAIYERLLADNKDASIASASAYELALMSFEKKDYAAVAQLENFARGTNAYLKDFYWMLAESETALSNQAAAAQFYGKIAGEFPSSDRAAPALFKSAQLAQAAKQWKEAASLYHQAQKAGSKGDLAADALLASAYCLGEAGDREAALQDLAALSAAYPNFAGMDRALYRKAQLEVELDRADQARATLEQLLKKYPQSETAASGHYLLGVLLEKAKEFGAADQNYRVAEQGKLKAPLADQVRLRRVAVLQRLGKDEEAAELLQTHLKTPAASEIPVALLDWLARFDLGRERYADADAAATQLAVVATDPTWKQIAWYTAGRGRQALGNAAGAREAYQQALAVDAKTREGVEAAMYLGQVGLDTSDFDAAANYYSKAAEMAASDDLLDIRARSYFGLGETARARGQWEEASRYYMSVAVLFDDAKLAPESLYRAAEAFDHLGRAADRDKAKEELKQRFPDSDWAKKP